MPLVCSPVERRAAFLVLRVHRCTAGKLPLHRLLVAAAGRIVQGQLGGVHLQG